MSGQFEYKVMEYINFNQISSKLLLLIIIIIIIIIIMCKPNILRLVYHFFLQIVSSSQGIVAHRCNTKTMLG